MGPQSEGIFSQFSLSADDSKKYELVIGKFDSHFAPKRNVIHERAMFNKRDQLPNESAESFIRALYEMAERCDFGTSKDDAIRDRLVVGISDKELSQRLQIKPDLKLDDAITDIRQAEIVKAQVSAQAAPTKAIGEVKTKAGPRPPRQHQKPKPQPAPKQSNKDDKCGKCGLVHRVKCPAKGVKCKKCHKVGHFARCCRSVGEVEDTSLDQEDFFFGAVYVNDAEQEQWYVTLTINNVEVNFKIDTGADVSLMTTKTYESLKNPPKLTQSTHHLHAVSGPLKAKGTFLARTTYNNETYDFNVYVVDTTSNLLSRTMSQKMGLLVLNLQELNANNPYGLMKGDPVKIQLKDGAKPFHCNTARRVPVPLLPKVREELSRMENAGIIEKISEPTEWCSPIVVVPKSNGQVRICVDLRQLNREVNRERYILPTLDDTATKMNGATVFTHLDLTSGYYHLMLHPDSAKLTTFITPFGRFYFKRLPFGLTSASEIFQRKMTELLEGIDGVDASQDDILISGKTMTEHDERLDKVLRIVHDSGLKLNLAKCEWRKSELTFLGHKFSKDGVRPDPEKVKAIVNMPAPTNIQELQRIRGMINYLGAFIPNLASIMKPMNDLLKSDVEWQWGTEQNEAYAKVKQAIVKAPTLAYYDPNKPTTVSADASSYGLGAVLLQEDNNVKKPVAFASRTLSSAETRYAQIEKECLASVWACEKFDRYLRGLQQFDLQTDHKPLVPLINGNDLNSVPMRCQRLLMRMMRYNPKAVHVPGKQLVVADTLSRSPVCSPEPSDSVFVLEVHTYVSDVIQSWPMSCDRLEEIKIATDQDDTMQEAIKLTIEGWPRHPKDVPRHLTKLYAERAHLSVAERLLVYDGRIVIPTALRPKILEIIHHGHQGITKSRQRANGAVWWPGISRDIADMVYRCAHCQTYKTTQHKEPLIPSPLPQSPWHKIGVDLLSFEGKQYLAAMDYYSRYLEIMHLPSTTANIVIAKLKSIFARWGIPLEVITDNGPQFDSQLFKDFALSYGFKHTTSSPHFAQANGEAECAVKIAKSILRQEDPMIALMIYRSSPSTATGYSPSEIMLQRQIRTTLPTLPAKTEYKPIDQFKLEQRHKESQERNEFYYNRRNAVRPLPELMAGDKVRIRTPEDKHWSSPATVVSDAGTPRSYIVKTTKGTLRRNRNHLQLIPSQQTNQSQITQESMQMFPQQVESKQTTKQQDSQQHSNQDQPSTVQTRSGRQVKAPDRLNI